MGVDRASCVHVVLLSFLVLREKSAVLYVGWRHKSSGGVLAVLYERGERRCECDECGRWSTAVLYRVRGTVGSGTRVFCLCAHP